MHQEKQLAAVNRRHCRNPDRGLDHRQGYLKNKVHLLPWVCEDGDIQAGCIHTKSDKNSMESGVPMVCCHKRVKQENLYH